MIHHYPEEIDLFSVHLTSMHQPGEKKVLGEERLNRVRSAGLLRLDAQVFKALCDNQNLIPSHWNDSSRYRYICFEGTVIKDQNGLSYVYAF